jgi:Tol biopolymer transport system component
MIKIPFGPPGLILKLPGQFSLELGKLSRKNETMSSSKPIPKTQAFALIGGVIFLLLCACVGLIAWRLWPTQPSTAAVAAYPIVYDGDGWLERGIYAIKPEGGEPLLLAHQLPTGAYIEPAWSPGGASIAFVVYEADEAEIYVMNMASSKLTNITNHPAWDTNPAWSPDGSQIAFSTDRGNGDEIFIMNSDGSNLRQLTQRSGYTDRQPAWSFDGSKIAFSGEAETEGKYYDQIFVINADGSGLAQLTRNPGDCYSPAWSPDGTRIAFTYGLGDDHEIYVMKTDGSDQINLTNHPDWQTSPVWSPDGLRIAFAFSGIENWDIYVMNADGSNQTRLTQNRGYDGNPDWKR